MDTRRMKNCTPESVKHPASVSTCLFLLWNPHLVSSCSVRISGQYSCFPPFCGLIPPSYHKHENTLQTKSSIQIQNIIITWAICCPRILEPEISVLKKLSRDRNSPFLPRQLFKTSLILWMKKMWKIILSLWNYAGGEEKAKPNILGSYRCEHRISSNCTFYPYNVHHRNNSETMIKF